MDDEANGVKNPKWTVNDIDETPERQCHYELSVPIIVEELDPKSYTGNWNFENTYIYGS